VGVICVVTRYSILMVDNKGIWQDHQVPETTCHIFC